MQALLSIPRAASLPRSCSWTSTRGLSCGAKPSRASLGTLNLPACQLQTTAQPSSFGASTRWLVPTRWYGQDACSRDTLVPKARARDQRPVLGPTLRSYLDNWACTEEQKLQESKRDEEACWLQGRPGLGAVPGPDRGSGKKWGTLGRADTKFHVGFIQEGLESGWERRDGRWIQHWFGFVGPQVGTLVDTVLIWSLCQALVEHCPATKPRTLGFLAQM